MVGLKLAGCFDGHERMARGSGDEATWGKVPGIQSGYCIFRIGAGLVKMGNDPQIYPSRSI